MSSADVLEPEIAPTAVGDDALYEVVDDRRVVLPPMGAYENQVAFNLSMKIGRFVEDGGLGQASMEQLFRLLSQPNTQRRPDAAFISFERWPKGRRIPRGNAWDVVPDLDVEVVSPTNLAEEIPTKIREYFEAGVRKAWVIYSHESLVYEYDSPRSVRVLGLEDALEGGAVIPGFRLAVSGLLEGKDEAAPPE